MCNFNLTKVSSPHLGFKVDVLNNTITNSDYERKYRTYRRVCSGENKIKL